MCFKFFRWFWYLTGQFLTNNHIENSIFRKVVGLGLSFTKNRTTLCFPVKLTTFWRPYILENTCRRFLLTNLKSVNGPVAQFPWHCLLGNSKINRQPFAVIRLNWNSATLYFCGIGDFNIKVIQELFKNTDGSIWPKIIKIKNKAKLVLSKISILALKI